MIKFGGLTGDDNRGRLIGIGLSKENCRRLLAGEPITFELAEIGFDVVDVPGGTGSKTGPPMKARVLIVGGETEASILAELEDVAREVGAPVLKMEARLKT